MADFIDTSLIDGYAGGPHITEKQVGSANQGIVGAGDYVLEVGQCAKAQVLTNNSVRIFDAVYSIQGRRDAIDANDYSDVTIANGTQGMNRNDIIVRRYRKDEKTEIETVEYGVKKGTPASKATDPEVTTGDIRKGDLLHEMKLYRVKIEGLNIVAVEQLFEILPPINQLYKYLQKKADTYILGLSVSGQLTGEYLNSKPIYAKMVDVGALPNNTTKTVSTGLSNLDYVWIDPANSFCFSGGASYPIPYVDPKAVANSIGVRITGYGANIIVSTGTDWSSYAGIVTLKYTKK